MLCGDFILPESANYVSLFCYLNLRNLLYLITKSHCILLRCGSHLLQVGFHIEIQGSAGISVSQNLLNALDVRPATQEQAGTGMSQIVGRHIWKPRSLDKPLHVPGDGTWITRLKGIAWTAENKGSREKGCGMLPLLLLLELLQESQGAWNNRDRADGVCGFGLCHNDTAFGGCRLWSG